MYLYNDQNYNFNVFFISPSSPGCGRSLLIPHLCLLPRSALPMPGANSIRLSNSTAFAICDGLLRMSHCFILELPEPELKEIRRIVDSLLMTADLALDLMETDVSLNFDGLSIHPGEFLSPLAHCLTSFDGFQSTALLLGPRILVRSWSQALLRQAQHHSPPFLQPAAEAPSAVPPRPRCHFRLRFVFPLPLQGPT